MAKTNTRKRKGTKLPHPDLLKVMALSDEAIGRRLATQWDESLQQAGIRNAFHRIPLIRHQAQRYLDQAINSKDGCLSSLAMYLALTGDFERAGKAFRVSAQAAAHRAIARKLADSQMRVTKLGKQLDNLARWISVGKAFREKEKGEPVSDSALARYIAKTAGGGAGTIRREIPLLGLDKRSWLPAFEKRVKDNRAKAAKKYPSSCGSLR